MEDTNKTWNESWQTKKNREDNLTPFTSEYQPAPELKSKGRERKREAKKLMDYFMLMSEKSISEVEKIVKEKWKDMIVREALICQYIIAWFKDKKIMQDIINRHVSYAPIKQEVTWSDDQDLFWKVTFNIVSNWIQASDNSSLWK